MSVLQKTALTTLAFLGATAAENAEARPGPSNAQSPAPSEAFAANNVYDDYSETGPDAAAASADDMCKAYDALLTNLGTDSKMEAAWQPDGTVIALPHTTYLAEATITVPPVTGDAERSLTIEWPALEGQESRDLRQEIIIPNNGADYSILSFESRGVRDPYGEPVQCNVSWHESDNGEELEINCGADTALVIREDAATLSTTFAALVTSDLPYQIECKWTAVPSNGNGQTAPTVPTP